MDDDRGGEPPCYAHLLEPDAQTRADVTRWRKAERARLIAERQAMAVAERRRRDATLAERLDAEIGDPEGRVIALYWPFRGEPDLRGWAARCRARGARTALPVVMQKARPLVFRAWDGDSALTRGVWNIPVPPEAAPALRPDIVLAPVVGLDDNLYRLGYGGGFFDRTLARMAHDGPRPLVIGVGYDSQRIPTIFPLPHDVAMDRALLS